jgi:hypothetical protein
MEQHSASFKEFTTKPALIGLMRLIEEIDVDVYEYNSYIAGLASSYLKGVEIPKEDVKLDHDLEQRLTLCTEKLNEFVEYKHRTDRLATLLKECIDTGFQMHGC